MLVEQLLIGVQFRAVTWQPDKCEPLRFTLTEALHDAQSMHEMPVHDQVDLALDNRVRNSTNTVAANLSLNIMKRKAPVLVIAEIMLWLNC